VTDDIAAYGLGALPDAPDERDYPLSALYVAEGLTGSVVLPTSYAAPGMPPVLDQHATPMCVADSSAAMKGRQDKRSGRPRAPRRSPLASGARGCTGGRTRARHGLATRRWRR
jgi:hypothetical protein